jgi:hypothetical protein
MADRTWARYGVQAKRLTPSQLKCENAAQRLIWAAFLFGIS